jgi:hypothetical protein
MLGKKLIGFSGEKLEKRSENGKKTAAPPPYMAQKLL